MAANERAKDENSARADRLAREREESDMAARERVLRGELALETYLTAYRGYSGKVLSAMDAKPRKGRPRRRAH